MKVETHNTEGPMPKSSLDAVTWSAEHQHYELSTSGQPQGSFKQEDQQSWQEWLSQRTSFAFQGQHGHLSVIKEARPRGAGYWYAYSTRERQTSKRYLGQTTRVTLQRLEQEALALAAGGSPVPRSERSSILHFPATSSPAPTKDAVPLLETRQVPPRLPAALVQRERLLRDLDSVLHYQLLLLSAPAGSGKTTLLSTWATGSAQKAYHIAWLSLDELDNDPTRFWSSIISTLHTCLPSIGEFSLAMLRSPQPPSLPTLLTTLLNELSSSSEEVILILDDYHVIEDQTIHESLIFWLDHLPAHLHMILSSRADPDLPLARWRVRGQLAEIRDADVRFTTDEATCFLSQATGRSLLQEDTLALANRTEGWVAGLQLAALSIRKREDLSAFLKEFTGSHRYLREYIQEEILRQQPPAVQRFLLQASVLTRMNAALCQAVTAEQELQASQAMLETLERENLFILPLDEQRQWYRFHTLFREALLAHLHANLPEMLPLLHQRAAHWYETHGLIHEAVAHALAAHDYTFIASVLEREAPQFWLHGEAKVILTWVMTLPDTVLQNHRDFALTSALYLLKSAQTMPSEQWLGAQTRSEQLIARVEHILHNEHVATHSETPQQAKLYNRIHLLHGLMDMRAALQEGDVQQLRTIAQQMQVFATEDLATWKLIPLYGLFMSAQVLGDAVLLLPELLAAKQQALQEQDRPTAIILMCWLAGAYLYGGYLHQLQRECLQAQTLLEQLGSQMAIAAYPALDFAYLYYAWNQLEKAEFCLQKAIQHAQHWQDQSFLIWSYSIATRVFLASGKMAEAEQALQQAQHLLQQSGLTVHAPEVMAAQVFLWLAHEDLAAAETWATDFAIDTHALQYIHAEAYLALARVYLALKQYPRCLELLTQLLSSAEHVQRQWDVIHILALQVAALHASGEVAQARQAASRLLALTEPEGYIRVYLDAGEPMQRVLQSLLDTSQDNESSTGAVPTSYISKLLASFKQAKRISSPAPHARLTSSVQPGAPIPNPSSSLIEPLTSREQEVLSLLAEGASNQDIANRLVISLTTVKKHVGSLLLKLEAENRTHAVARARELSLL